MKRLVLTVVVLFSILAIGQAHSLEKFDFEQRFFVEFGPEVKDHSLIRVDGEYHLFYLRGNPAIDIGHATSLDLVHWEIHEPVMSPGPWDDLALWAPQIVYRKQYNTWAMYYTGVNQYWSQQSGLATSSDLYKWNKFFMPVYHPNPLTWASWSENAWSHGRDPFVFEYEGQYYMLTTAKNWFGDGAISLAVSPALVSPVWQDVGPLYVNDTWHVLESVQWIERAGKYYLFFTEEVVGGTSYMKSDSALSGWNGAPKWKIDFGHAPEVNSFDDGYYVFSRHTTHNYGDGTNQFFIRFDSLMWAGDVPYVKKPWPLAGDWNQISGTGFAFTPTFLDNPGVRGENIDVGYEGLSWVSSYERYQGPLGVGSPGSAQGDGAWGTMHSRTFTITGYSINLLVGGGDYPDECFVALVDANTQEVLFKETGKNTDEMDRRYWDVRDHAGKEVYFVVQDMSTAPFGHISCDDLQESYEIVGNSGGGMSGGDDKTRPGGAPESQMVAKRALLFQNSPNPFNPSTTISYQLPTGGYATIDVFDVNGTRIRRLLSRNEGPGTHDITWDGKNDHSEQLSTGIYFYRLTLDGGVVDTKKMILLK